MKLLRVLGAVLIAACSHPRDILHERRLDLLRGNLALVLTELNVLKSQSYPTETQVVSIVEHSAGGSNLARMTRGTSFVLFLQSSPLTGQAVTDVSRHKALLFAADGSPFRSYLFDGKTDRIVESNADPKSVLADWNIPPNWILTSNDGGISWKLTDFSALEAIKE
jgi:hypothetical protein